MPRAIATTPVRDTSDNPSGFIKSIKASIFLGEPLSSNTNEEMDKIAAEISPKLSAHSDAIKLIKKLSDEKS